MPLHPRKPGQVATEGDDIVLVTQADDWVQGLAGDDLIVAGAGNDTILGDSLDGPRPPLRGGSPPDGVPPGNNLILAGAGADLVNAGWGSDTVLGGAGDDVIIGYGGNLPSPTALAAYQRVDGPDLLFGGRGDDTLLGAGGSDTLVGGPGDDRLIGGYGPDLLMGGRGADVFVFHPQGFPFLVATDSGPGAAQRDVILDFGAGDDRIDLNLYRFEVAPAPAFLGAGAFTDDPGLQVRYEIVGDITLVQFVARGNTAVGHVALAGEIELHGAHVLSASDFILTV